MKITNSQHTNWKNILRMKTVHKLFSQGTVELGLGNRRGSWARFVKLPILYLQNKIYIFKIRMFQFEL